MTGNDIAAALRRAAEALEDRRSELDALNVFPVPDGDTGANMNMTLSASAEAAGAFPGDSSACAVMDHAASAALLAARGNSGVILSLILRGFARAVHSRGTLTGADIAAGLSLGAKYAYDAVLDPLEGTILTVARRAAEGAQKAAEAGSPPCGVLRGALAEAERALAETTKLLPELERAGVVDAGGQGLVYILRAIAGDRRQETGGNQDSGFRKKGTGGRAIRKDDLPYAYCLDFILRGRTDTEALRERLSQMGGSLIIAGEDGELLKVHLHTNSPEDVLRAVSGYGEITSEKIEDMRRTSSGEKLT